MVKIVGNFCLTESRRNYRSVTRLPFFVQRNSEIHAIDDTDDAGKDKYLSPDAYYSTRSKKIMDTFDRE